MEIWSVIGYRKVSFHDERTKRDIAGYSLFLTRKENEHITGEECQKIFIQDRIDYVPEIGDVIQLFYNRFGKISDIKLV